MVSYDSGDLLTGIVPSNMTAAISITDGNALLTLLGTGKPVTVASDTGLPVRSKPAFAHPASAISHGDGHISSSTRSLSAAATGVPVLNRRVGVVTPLLGRDP